MRKIGASGGGSHSPNPMAVTYQPQIEAPADPSKPPPLPPKRPKSVLRNPSDRIPPGPPPRGPPTNIINTSSASLLSLVSAQEWTIDQVCQWLALDTRLERYIQSFRQFNISGHTLLQMRNENFQALGIYDDTDRATLKRRLRELKAADQKIQQERQRSSLLSAQDPSPQQTSASSLPGVGGTLPLPVVQPQPPLPLPQGLAVVSQSAMDQIAGVRSPNLVRHAAPLNSNPQPPPGVHFLDNKPNTYTPLSPRLVHNPPAPVTAPLLAAPPPPPAGSAQFIPASFNVTNNAMLPPVPHPPPPASRQVQVPTALPVAPQPPLPQHLGKNLGAAAAQQPARPGSAASYRAAPQGGRPDPRDPQGRGGANAGSKTHLTQV